MPDFKVDIPYPASKGMEIIAEICGRIRNNSIDHSAIEAANYGIVRQIEMKSVVPDHASHCRNDYDDCLTEKYNITYWYGWGMYIHLTLEKWDGFNDLSSMSRTYWVASQCKIKLNAKLVIELSKEDICLLSYKPNPQYPLSATRDLANIIETIATVVKDANKSGA